MKIFFKSIETHLSKVLAVDECAQFAKLIELYLHTRPMDCTAHASSTPELVIHLTDQWLPPFFNARVRNVY